MTIFGYWFYTPSLLLMYQQDLEPVYQKSRNFSGPESSRDFRETGPCLRKQYINNRDADACRKET